MSIIRNWKTYYSLEESIKISDEYIEKSADKLVIELKKARANKVDSKKLAYV